MCCDDVSTSLSSSIVFIALERFDRFKDRIRVDLKISKQQKTTDNKLLDLLPDTTISQDGRL